MFMAVGGGAEGAGTRPCIHREAAGGFAVAALGVGAGAVDIGEQTETGHIELLLGDGLFQQPDPVVEIIFKGASHGLMEAQWFVGGSLGAKKRLMILAQDRSMLVRRHRLRLDGTTHPHAGYGEQPCQFQQRSLFG